MKKIYIVSLFAFGLIVPKLSSGQIDSLPNPGFEKWGKNGLPNLWDTTSALSPKGIVYDGAFVGGTVEKDSDFQFTVGSNPPVTVTPHQGKYFLNLQTVASQTTGVHVGYVKTKFAYTHRPQYFLLRLGFFPQEQGELAVAAINFTKWNPTTKTSETVLKMATGIPLPQGAPGFIPPWFQEYASLASKYMSADNPDSAEVQFQSGSGVSNGTQYAFGNNTTFIIDDVAFTMDEPAGVEMVDLKDFTGVVSYPNPFTGKTTIHYTLTGSSLVNLTVYDMQGREISNIVNERQVPGVHDAIFDGSNIKNGVYFYRLQSGNDVQVGKLILSK